MGIDGFEGVSVILESGDEGEGEGKGEGEGEGEGESWLFMGRDAKTRALVMHWQDKFI